MPPLTPEDRVLVKNGFLKKAASDPKSSKNYLQKLYNSMQMQRDLRTNPPEMTFVTELGFAAIDVCLEKNTLDHLEMGHHMADIITDFFGKESVEADIAREKSSAIIDALIEHNSVDSLMKATEYLCYQVRDPSISDAHYKNVFDKQTLITDKLVAIGTLDSFKAAHKSLEILHDGASTDRRKQEKEGGPLFYTQEEKQIVAKASDIIDAAAKLKTHKSFELVLELLDWQYVNTVGESDDFQRGLLKAGMSRIGASTTTEKAIITHGFDLMDEAKEEGHLFAACKLWKWCTQRSPMDDEPETHGKLLTIIDRGIQDGAPHKLEDLAFFLEGEVKELKENTGDPDNFCAVLQEKINAIHRFNLLQDTDDLLLRFKGNQSSSGTFGSRPEGLKPSGGG